MTINHPLYSPADFFLFDRLKGKRFTDNQHSKQYDGPAESHSERTHLQEFPRTCILVPNSALPSMEIILKDCKLYLMLYNTVFEIKIHSLNFLEDTINTLLCYLSLLESYYFILFDYCIYSYFVYILYM